MPKPTKGARLGSGPAHQKLLLGGLATSLFIHDRIKTTEAKAKALRPFAERLITFAKRGDVSARREVLKVVTDRDVVHRLFAEIAPRFAERDGGYTRILKLGPRKGDGAPMAQIELLEEGDGAERPARSRAAEDEEPEGGKRRRGLRGRLGRRGAKSGKAAAGGTEETPEPEEPEEPEEPDAAPDAAGDEDGSEAPASEAEKPAEG